MGCGPVPVQVTIDRAPVYPRVVEDLVPGAQHVAEQLANDVVEADHGRLKARLRPMSGLKRMPSARTIATGHAFVQNLRRGHYDITADLPVHDRVGVAFTTLAACLSDRTAGQYCHPSTLPPAQRNSAVGGAAEPPGHRPTPGATGAKRGSRSRLTNT